MSKINLTTIVREVADKSAVSTVIAQTIISEFVRSIVQHLNEGEEVTLTGFGQFSARDIPARVCRNPKTGEPVIAPSCRRAVFRPSRTLRETLNQG